MPIDAYVGKPGSGKSYGVVQHVIIPSLKQGRHVVTNIPLEIDALLMDFGGQVTQLPDDWYEREDLADLAPNGSVLILDELWRRWPAGVKANAVNPKDKALLAEHRHKVDKNGKSMRIVLVTQDMSQIAAFARALVETTYRMTKKTKKLFRVDIYSGAVTGDRPPKTALLRQTGGSYRAEIYRYYKSATMSETGDVGDESKADTRASFFKSYSLWGLIFIMIIGSVSGTWSLYKYFSPAFKDSSQQAPQSHSLVNPPPPAALVSTPSPPAVAPASAGQRVSGVVYGTSVDGPVASTTWRVGGYLTRADSEKSERQLVEQVVLVNTGGSGRRIVRVSDCHKYAGQDYYYCDFDGERVTPWSGKGSVTTVLDQSGVTTLVNPSPGSSTTAVSQRAGERSDPAAGSQRPVQAHSAQTM